MHDADVLLHVLERVTAGRHRARATPEVDPEARCRRRHDRSRSGARARHCRVQHAGRQYARRCGAHVAADAGDAPAAVRARHDRHAPGRGWALDPELLDTLGELGGRTVGLVGFGAVGKCLAPMLDGIGATVIYTSRTRIADTAAAIRFASRVAVRRRRRLAARSADRARPPAMIDERAIRKMKQGVGSRQHRKRRARRLRRAAPCACDRPSARRRARRVRVRAR